MKLISRLFLSLLVLSPMAQADKLPNFIVIFCDDLGYGDLGGYGSEKNRTPNLDQMAKEGMRFTDFYSSSPVCTPSRASLLTGCYPRRIGMHEAETEHWVLIPRNKRGLHPDETTVAELLKTKGYATACIGKWHLGDQPEHLPTEHGFDEYYGIPYSNDMQSKKRGDPPLPLVRGKEVIEAPADQSTLTKRYTEEVIRFIEKKKDGPFFVYLPHTFPHLPLFASPDFKDKSANGRYGDSVEEIDWSTGEILKALKRLKIDDNTLVIFTSDNGSNNRNGASNGPLNGAKGSTREGGMRVPMIARWPATIPAGSECKVLTSTMDILPTFAAITGAELPKKTIDGHNILAHLKGGADESPYEAFYYYRRRQLQAIRMGDWKWRLPLKNTYPRWDNAQQTGKGDFGALFKVNENRSEEGDQSKFKPEVLEKMKALAAKIEADIGNEDRAGKNQRPALDLPESKPMLLPEK